MMGLITSTKSEYQQEIMIGYVQVCEALINRYIRLALTANAHAIAGMMVMQMHERDLQYIDQAIDITNASIEAWEKGGQDDE